MLRSFLATLAIATTSLVQCPAWAETATYYSDYYQGRRTASGELFDTWAYTAAHPTLPMGTWVRVTNLSNNRFVEVRINDRCRCGIDLSKAAAEQIGMMQAGVVEVSIEAVNEQRQD